MLTKMPDIFQPREPYIVLKKIETEQTTATLDSRPTILRFDSLQQRMLPVDSFSGISEISGMIYLENNVFGIRDDEPNRRYSWRVYSPGASFKLQKEETYGEIDALSLTFKEYPK